MIEDIKQIKKEVGDILQRLDALEKKLSTSSVFDRGEFEELKGLLNSEDWPEAVPEFQIADESSESDKEERAESIVDLFVGLSSSGNKFLDFGCGEGHVPKYMSQRNFSVGYDILRPKHKNSPWDFQSDMLVFTSDFDVVKSHGPYDEILIYDVLDHAEDPVGVLKMAKSVLSESGLIKVRCHPWCSRHGGHLYRQINKAFVHLVFSEAELSEMGVVCDKTIINKVIYPIATYEMYISKANLSKISMDIDNHEPESFFSETHVVAERIKLSMPEEGGIKHRQTFPSFQIQQCFVDFILQ